MKIVRIRRIFLANLPACIFAVVLFAILSLRFCYSGYWDQFGELDSYRVANGLVDKINQHGSYADSLLYGVQASALYYRMLAILAPLASAPGHFAIGMNLFAALFSGGAALVVGALAGRWCGRIGGLAAALSLFSVPLWWKVSAYAHPTWPAIFFFLSAVMLAVRLDGRPRRDAAAYACIVLCLTCSLASRVDTIVMAPMMLGAVWVDGKIHWQRAAILAACGVLALALSPMLFGVGDVAGVPHNDDLASMWFTPANYLKYAGDSAVRFILAVNPAILLAAGAAVIVAVRQREWQLLALTVPVAVADFVFWIPLGHRERHFVVVLPAIGILIGYALAYMAERGPGARQAVQFGMGVALVLLGACAWSGADWSLYLAALPFTALSIAAAGLALGLEWRRAGLAATLMSVIALSSLGLIRHRFYNNLIWPGGSTALAAKAATVVAQAQGGTLYVIASGPDLAAYIQRIRPGYDLSQTPIIQRTITESDEWLEFRTAHGLIAIYDEGWNQQAALASLLSRTKGQPAKVLVDKDIAPLLATSSLEKFHLIKSVM